MNQPALLIAGTHSGCGKTTLTLGIMAALKQRGIQVTPFKSGPDFIDPTLHTMVTGEVSRNLDIRMSGVEFVTNTFTCHAPLNGGCSVIEGVMGLFDGGEGSAAHLAKTLQIPVVLVVDVRSAAESVAAVVKGFTTLDPAVQMAGVICNRVGSERHRELIAQALETYCPEVPILGFIPREQEVSMPSRHLGLHMGEESPLAEAQQDTLVQLISEHLDLDRLMKIAEKRPPLLYEGHSVCHLARKQDHPIRIGIARDEAFCFYYQDNLDLLPYYGAELVFFSPLHDKHPPRDLAGIYIGGGYPELYARQLSENSTMRDTLLFLAESGLPIYAECGGFMYLTQGINDQDGRNFPMVGVFACETTMQPHLRRLGYRQPRIQHHCILGAKGKQVYGHEFHYSKISGEPPQTPVGFVQEDGRGKAYQHKNVLAGYVHLHWGRTPELAASFVSACRQYLES